MSLSPNQEFLFTRQRHEADRMGLHWDYRFVVGDKAYSFATKKEMPEPGKAILLFEQPVHDAAYALSERVEIPKGQYGAGVTTLDFVHKARVGENSTPEQMTLYINNGQKFLLKKTKDDKAWFFKNLTKETGMENKYLEKIAEFRIPADKTSLLRNAGVDEKSYRNALQRVGDARAFNANQTRYLEDQAFNNIEGRAFKNEDEWHKAHAKELERLRAKAPWKATPDTPRYEETKRNGALLGVPLTVAGWTGGMLGVRALALGFKN